MTESTVTRLRPRSQPAYTDTAALNDIHALLTTTTGSTDGELLGDIALAVTRTEDAEGSGARTGFGGRRYASRLLQSLSYDDAFADYLAFLEPRLRRARDLLASPGTLYFHIDYREAHY